METKTDILQEAQLLLW